MRHDTDAVLLTGVTGFVGAAVLARYLDRTARPVVALARARSVSEAEARVRAVLHDLYEPGVGRGFRTPYEQTKHEAEVLLRSREVPLPLQIVRPSIVVGDRATGWTRAFNVLYWPLQMFATGRLPVIPATSGAPVDVVSV